MARWFEPTRDNVMSYAEWVMCLPARVQRLAKHVVPWELYKLKTTGERVTFLSFGDDEDGGRPAIYVLVSPMFNRSPLYRVHAVTRTSDLSPCPLPNPRHTFGLVVPSTALH